uniref:Uncharacterized protein n=1 Tax=Aegilops tauschii subsp. strangulata TaxID=200361 RepID=A0A453A7Y8_AEGTS
MSSHLYLLHLKHEILYCVCTISCPINMLLIYF